MIFSVALSQSQELSLMRVRQMELWIEAFIHKHFESESSLFLPFIVIKQDGASMTLNAKAEVMGTLAVPAIGDVTCVPLTDSILVGSLGRL